jgi:hypothetical protein
MKDSRFSTLLPFLLLLSLALVTQIALASTAIDERGPADLDGRVKVDNVAGSLSIIGWDRPEVEVSGELGDGAELRFQADGDRTLVSVRKRSGVRRMKASHLVVRIPAGSELGANGVSAALSVESMSGPQRLETVSGSIDAELAALEIEVTSVSGRIRIVGEGQVARTEASSVSGKIRLDNIAGEVKLNSVSGKLELNAGLLSRVGMNSTSGKVVAELGLGPSSRLQAETISGDIRLLLADADDLQVDVETFSGSIDNCFNEQEQRKQKYGPGRTLRFERGAANRAVRVESLSGDVDLCSVSQR